MLRELNIGLVPFAPLGHGFLTGRIRSTDGFEEGDFRHGNPRFTGENFRRNLALADEVQAVAADAGATPAQVALAWLLAQGDDIAPIPGTKRVHRVEENTAADALTLAAEQLDKLSSLPPRRARPTPRPAGGCSNAETRHAPVVRPDHRYEHPAAVRPAARREQEELSCVQQ